jgi:hypothetical protein
MASVDLPAFHIAGMKDFSFKVTRAVVDMSDIANPAGLIEDELWRGFYLEELEVRLPQQLSSSRINVRNFIIDDQGVSGTVTATDVIPLGEANAGGWPLSVDRVGLTFSRNHLNGGELAGKLQIDFLGDEPLAYDAMINMQDGTTSYAFAVNTTETKQYRFFAGEITLNKDSRIQMTKTATAFIPVAILSGTVKLQKSVVKIDNISFQDLTLSTQAPYLHSGTFDIAVNGDAKMGGFPIGINDINVGVSDGQIGIGATVKLNLMNASDKGFAGATSFVITATRDWKLDKVKVNDISLNVAVMAFKMSGVLSIFDDHPVYGNGFRGFIKFSIPGPLPEAKATAYFGSKDDYRYWHVDAYVGVTIPITPIFKINGLMGGMSYHMERPPQFDPYDSRNALDQKGGMKELNEIFQYVPVREAGLGFMGGVSLALQVDMVVNANVVLEVQFGTDGGFRYAQFDGAGYVLHLPVKAKSKSEAGEDESAPVWVKFMMRYDNVNHTFDANSKTYINIVGVLKGVNERGLVGEAALHISQGEWWFFVGRPSQMFGLSILGLAEVRTYFMMGTKVEDMPPLPPEVNEVFDDVNTDFMAMENAMKNGSGFGFGVHFKAGFKFDYGVFGEFAVGAGSDVLLRDYGEARCKGSNEVIGFNGWYASGQAYAFLKGDIGIRAKALGRKRDFSIAKLSAAVLLQAKMPNPAWFRGMVGVKYEIMGGLIKGSSNIKVQLGSQCELASVKELNIAIISDIKPATDEVSVFATPQVAFNIPVAKPFSMLNENDEVATYRIRLEDLQLLHDKTVIPGAVVINAAGTSASLELRDILPAVSTLTATAKVHVERQNGNDWIVLKNDREEKTISFTTGAAPDYIPWENVAYTYPVKGQTHYLPNEYSKGYVKLKRGQPALFATPAEGILNGEIAVKVSYDEANAQVNIEMPDTLKNSTACSLVIKSKPVGNKVADNISSEEVYSSEDTMTVNRLKGDAVSEVRKAIISYDFSTSRYNTFKEKMTSVSSVKDLYDVATGYISVIGQRFYADEVFDAAEIESLIVPKAGLNNWLQQRIIPLLYKESSPPLDAVKLYNDRLMYYVSWAAYNDYCTQRQASASRYLIGGQMESLLLTPYPDLSGNQYYPVELQYRLPGTNIITSSVTQNIYYKL